MANKLISRTESSSRRTDSQRGVDGPRIIIGPPGELGICAQSFALVCALRDRFPAAWLVWILEEDLAAFAHRHSCVDRLVRVPRHWPRSRLLTWWLRSSLHGEAGDIGLDPRSTTVSAWALWLSGASQRIGFDPPRGRGLSRWLNNTRVPLLPAATDGVLSLLAPLGGEPTTIRYCVPRQPGAEIQIDSWIRQTHLADGFVVIDLDCGPKATLIAARRCGQLARELGERRRLTSVVLRERGSPPAAIERVLLSSGGHAVAPPSLDLPEKVALVRRARLFVGLEPGWLQLAAALGTPSLGVCAAPVGGCQRLFGSLLVWLDSYLDGPERRQLGRQDAICDVPLEVVGAACARLLDQAAAARAA